MKNSDEKFLFVDDGSDTNKEIVKEDNVEKISTGNETKKEKGSILLNITIVVFILLVLYCIIGVFIGPTSLEECWDGEQCHHFYSSPYFDVLFIMAIDIVIMLIIGGCKGNLLQLVKMISIIILLSGNLTGLLASGYSICTTEYDCQIYNYNFLNFGNILGILFIVILIALSSNKKNELIDS